MADYDYDNQTCDQWTDSDEDAIEEIDDLNTQFDGSDVRYTMLSVRIPVPQDLGAISFRNGAIRRLRQQYDIRIDGALACVECSMRGDARTCYMLVESKGTGITTSELEAALDLDGCIASGARDPMASIDFMRRTGAYAGRRNRMPATPTGFGSVLKMANDTIAPSNGIGMVTYPTRILDMHDKRHELSCVAIAIETTGLRPHENEVVRIAMYGNYGRTQYERTFGVERPDSWSMAARKASGIGPDDVAGLLTFRQALIDDNRLYDILEDADIIIGHNITFIEGFIEATMVNVNLQDKSYGDSCSCFKGYAIGHNLYGASATLDMAAKCLGIARPRSGHTMEKAKATYGVWCELVGRRATRFMSLDDVHKASERKERRTSKATKRAITGAISKRRGKSQADNASSGGKAGDAQNAATQTRKKASKIKAKTKGAATIDNAMSDADSNITNSAKATVAVENGDDAMMAIVAIE